jgi:hypothetical protein
MKKLLSFVVALIGCSSSKDPAPSPCADISGNYNVTANVTGGTCDPSLFKSASAVSFAKGAGGSWSIVIAAVPGGCPGTLDEASCHFTANCEVEAPDGGSPLATFSYDLKFTGSGFTGSEVGGLHPPAVPAACTANFQETGSKL